MLLCKDDDRGICEQMSQTLEEMRQDGTSLKIIENIWMIPRSIWRWMILGIKRKKREKRIQLFGALIGICVAVVSLCYFFHAEKQKQRKEW